jgi:hypothetical protein
MRRRKAAFPFNNFLEDTMNLKPNILIFSVYQTQLTGATNEANHNRVVERLTNMSVPFTELLGKYNGIAEKQILVADLKNEVLVHEFANQYNQESYLRSHNDRFSELIHLKADNGNDFIQAVGYLMEVSETEAEASKYYSYSPKTNQYFITKGA